MPPRCRREQPWPTAPRNRSHVQYVSLAQSPRLVFPKEGVKAKSPAARWKMLQAAMHPHASCDLCVAICSTWAASATGWLAPERAPTVASTFGQRHRVSHPLRNPHMGGGGAGTMEGRRRCATSQKSPSLLCEVNFANRPTIQFPSLEDKKMKCGPSGASCHEQLRCVAVTGDGLRDSEPPPSARSSRRPTQPTSSSCASHIYNETFAA